VNEVEDITGGTEPKGRGDEFASKWVNVGELLEQHCAGVELSGVRIGKL
jgi:hypothetical protein